MIIGRVINVVSHCGINSLPGLSVYGATKAALCSWSDALQSELDKFNVKVIKFFPGAHVLTTNLMSNHKNHVAEMENLMSQEQTFFYKNYFDKYNSYLYSLSERKPVQKVNDRSFLTPLRPRYSISIHLVVILTNLIIIKCTDTYFRIVRLLVSGRMFWRNS